MARPAVPLLLCLMGLGACDRPPAPAATPKPAPPVRRMGEGEAEWVFKKILQRHRDLLLGDGICGVTTNWFISEQEYFRTDGRLFAEAFPKLAERLAVEVLDDTEAPEPDRLYAWFILEVLAPRTSVALEEFLTEQVNSIPDERRDERDLALSNLIRRRFDDRTLALCRAQARQGSSTAYDALSTVVDPETIRLFQELNDAEMLERIAVLQSKEWRESLWHILMGRKRSSYPLTFVWALEAAERQKMPELRSAVELRLQQIRKRSVTREMRLGSDDPDYEFLLVFWMRQGGALEAREKEYLAYYGFYGDFEQRLQELLATRRDPSRPRARRSP